MSHHRLLVSLHLLLAALAAAWLLWPVAGPPPWRVEVDADAWRAGVNGRAGALAPEAVSRALSILDPDGALSALVEHGDHLRIREPYTGAVAALPWRPHPAADPPPPADGETPLAGLRIVLDPGHHGGAWSVEEARHFPVWAVAEAPDADARIVVTAGEDVPPPEGGRLIGVLREGDLAWVTARILEAELTAAGAEVHLTRGPPPLAAFPGGIDPRFDADREARLWLEEARHGDPILRGWARLVPMRIARVALERRIERRVREDLHDLYTRFDLRRRAAVAEEVDADLTLSIHYNYARFPEHNYVVVFMPGHKREEELRSPSARFHALARLVEGDLPLTAELGRRIGQGMHARLDMPQPPAFAPAPGARPMRWPVDEDARLFARNLAIVRRAPGPVLLLEGPFMNHPIEALRLLEADGEIDGISYPERARVYAEAVRDAVVESAPLLHARRARRAGRHAAPGGGQAQPASGI